LLERNRLVITDYLTELLLTGCAKEVGGAAFNCSEMPRLKLFFQI
jgi:hypothetical protein